MRTTWLFLMLALVCVPAWGRAQDNTVFAQQRYQRGVGFYDARDFEHALEEFRASLALYASPNTRLYEARCLRELGRLAEAVPSLERTVREAADRAQTDPRYAATRDAAQAELRSLEPRVARLTLAVPGIPAGARVQVGGREIPAAGLGVPMPVMPGRVEVVIEAEGYVTERRAIDATAGQESSLEVRVQRVPTLEGHRESPWPSGRPPVAPVVPPPRRSPLRTLAWVGFGVGAAGLVSFGVFGLLASGRFESLNMQCGGGACTDAERDAIAGGRTLTTLANVSLVVGIAGAASGALLYVLGRPPRPPPVRVGIGVNEVSVGGVF